LPHELSEEQNRYLVQDFIKENFTRKGYVADLAIHRAHEGGDKRNIHAHLMVTTRHIEGNEFASHKDRTENTKEQLAQWRADWAHHLSRHLRRHGYELEADRMAEGFKTLPEQRAAAEARGDLEFAASLKREPTIHLGKDAAAMERRGIETDKGDVNRAIVAENDRQAAQPIILDPEKLFAQAKETPQAATPEAMPEPLRPQDPYEARKAWAERLRSFGEFPTQRPTIEQYGERETHRKEGQRDYTALHETHKLVAEQLKREQAQAAAPDRQEPTPQPQATRTDAAAPTQRRETEKADTMGKTADKVLGGITGGIEGAAAALENFFLGGTGGAPTQPGQPQEVQEPPLAKQEKYERNYVQNMEPHMRANDPHIARMTVGVDPHIVAEIRRAREAREAAERERDDQGGRER
jgi:hypothetical protein